MCDFFSKPTFFPLVNTGDTVRMLSVTTHIRKLTRPKQIWRIQ